MEDCPSSRVWLRDKNDRISGYSLAYELTAPLHPKGTCCRNILPLEPKGRDLGLKEASEKTIDGVNFRVKLNKDKGSSDKSFRMLLTGREVSNKYFMEKFTIDGVDLRASPETLGYVLYEVQMTNVY